MTSEKLPHRNRFALAALIVVLLASGCHRTRSVPSLLYIMLTFNEGACEQNGSTGIIDVYRNQAVIYQAAAELPEFEVQFQECPFSSCPVNSPHGTSMNVGQPKPRTEGTIFKYSSMTINNQGCDNAGAMGVRIRAAQ